MAVGGRLRQLGTRRLRSFGAGSNPLKLPDLALWLDAADSSTLTFDISGNVQQANDKSGYGRNALQTNALRRPGISTINGVQALNFEGTDDFLTVTHGSWADLPSYSIYGVVSMADTSLAFRGWIGKENSAATRKLLIGNDSSTGLFYSSTLDSINAGKAAAYANNVPVLISAHKDGNTSARSFVNGAAGTVDTTVTTGTTTADIGIGSGAAYGGYLWPGQVGEILIYDTHHDSATRGLIETYLKAKWGTP
jgi:hypothetical protein